MVRNQSNRHWLKALPLPDPETRHMDLTAVEMNPQIILIIAGCSDGMLRFFEFDTIGLTLTMCNVCELDQHCILKVFSFKFKESVVAVSMTTDGKASFWNAGTVLSQGKEDPPVRPFKQFRIHELGINSSAFHYQSEYLILTTGSDDTSVKVNAFSLGGGDSVSILCSWYSKELHNCQVTVEKRVPRTPGVVASGHGRPPSGPAGLPAESRTLEAVWRLQDLGSEGGPFRVLL
ncbi:hypothetical protein AAG570_010862 [Ranatra chinensis]|uniref:Uncharacterized protein n=1 Tax=Ranatra chinensis TaxID=642074 RepID=A0ABD0YJ96_9HEMI